MCGIAGFFSLGDTKLSQETLAAMNNSLRHRGPDAEGTYLNGAVGLAHRRLSIIDLSEKANQPMISANGNYVIIFNGEVYNYQELAGKYLNKKVLKSSSDTEVLVELFDTIGINAFAELNGMFAGAIYDVRNEQLFLFRDQWGKKPLFYYQNQDCIVFASEIKALKQVPIIKFELNTLAIPQFLHLNFIPEPSTIDKNIFKLNAGHYLKIAKQKIEKHRFSKMREANVENAKSKLIDVKRDLRQLLEKAVAYRLTSDVPYGALLSGGVDSSLITAIAQQISHSKLKTFTIGFQDAKFDESTYARQVATHLGTEHHELRLDINEALDLVDKIFTVYDEPFGDTSALPTMLVSQLVRKHAKMVLTGDGGDELFMGYGTHVWAKRLSNPLLKSMHRSMSGAFGLMGGKFQKASNLIGYEHATNMQSHIFSQEQGFFSSRELNRMLTPQYRTLDTHLFEIHRNKGTSEAVKQSLWDMQYYLKEDLLVKIDRASMLHGLEMRSPFLDRNVADYALALPEQMKLNNGVGKYILKEILKDYLPESYFNRPKQGFSIPLSKWLRAELRNLVDIFAGDEVTKEYGIFDPIAVAKIRTSYLAGNDFLYHRLWLIICLHKWLRVNI